MSKRNKPAAVVQHQDARPVVAMEADEPIVVVADAVEPPKPLAAVVAGELKISPGNVPAFVEAIRRALAWTHEAESRLACACPECSLTRELRGLLV